MREEGENRCLSGPPVVSAKVLEATIQAHGDGSHPHMDPTLNEDPIP